MDVPGLPVEIGADQLALAGGGDDREQAVAGGAELRLGAVARDEDGRTAAGGDPVNARILGPSAGREEAPLPPLERDRLAVGRETRPGIMAGLSGDVAGRPAARGDGADMAQPLVRPADEDDGPPIARPGREQLELRLVAFHQPPSGAARSRLDPQLAERLEHHLAAVGGNAGPARHLRLEAVGRDLHLRVQGVDDYSRVVDPERDLARAAAVA